MEAKKLDSLSLEQYLELEQSTATKYEYHLGSVFSMAGGTYNHGLICGNIFGELRAGLRAKKSDCTALNSEIKLELEAMRRYVYPDSMVICGEVQKSQTVLDAVLNPALIVEVLSKHTESYDRGDKLFFYRKIPTLQEYILIDQWSAQLDVFRREGELWNITRISGLDQALFLQSINLSIPLKDIYEGVEGMK